MIEKMTDSELIKEHKRLVKVLESGTSRQLKEEALRQKRELERYMRNSKFKTVQPNKHYRYCLKCKRQTEHLINNNTILCKTCGLQSKNFNAVNLLIG